MAKIDKAFIVNNYADIVAFFGPLGIDVFNTYIELGAFDVDGTATNNTTTIYYYPVSNHLISPRQLQEKFDNFCLDRGQVNDVVFIPWTKACAALPNVIKFRDVREQVLEICMPTSYMPPTLVIFDTSLLTKHADYTEVPLDEYVKNGSITVAANYVQLDLTFDDLVDDKYLSTLLLSRLVKRCAFVARHTINAAINALELGRQHLVTQVQQENSSYISDIGLVRDSLGIIASYLPRPSTTYIVYNTLWKKPSIDFIEVTSSDLYITPRSWSSTSVVLADQKAHISMKKARHLRGRLNVLLESKAAFVDDSVAPPRVTYNCKDPLFSKNNKKCTLPLVNALVGYFGLSKDCGKAVHQHPVTKKLMESLEQERDMQLGNNEIEKHRAIERVQKEQKSVMDVLALNGVTINICESEMSIVHVSQKNKELIFNDEIIRALNSFYKLSTNSNLIETIVFKGFQLSQKSNPAALFSLLSQFKFLEKVQFKSGLDNQKPELDSYSMLEFLRSKAVADNPGIVEMELLDSRNRNGKVDDAIEWQLSRILLDAKAVVAEKRLKEEVASHAVEPLPKLRRG